MRLGRHMSNPRGSMGQAAQIGCEAVQIFVTNPRAWQAPASDPTGAQAFQADVRGRGIGPVVVHAAYLINLATPREDVYRRSIELLTATVRRAADHGATSVVFHIGSHGGAGEEVGLAQLVEGLRRVLAESPDSVMVLLENDTGGGGKLGYSFTNLASVLDRLPEHAGRLGVCVDTAHLWGAGYDIGTPEGATATLDEIDRTLGLDRVPVVHLNDARAALGSHRDLHARLGEGMIGQEGLSTLLRSARVQHTTALLETPFFEPEVGQVDWDAEREHLGRARALAGLPALPAVAGDGHGDTEGPSNDAAQHDDDQPDHADEQQRRQEHVRSEAGR